MDLNDLRALVTLASFGLFIGIWVWAYSRRNRAAFDEAALLPLREEEPGQPDGKGGEA